MQPFCSVRGPRGPQRTGWGLRGPPGLDDYSISQCLKTHVWPLKSLIAYLNHINTWRMHCWEHDGPPYVQLQVWYGAFYSLIHNQLQNQTSFTLGKVCTPKSWRIWTEMSSALGEEHNNLGRLWLAYTELQGGLYMLQLISVDSRHFTLS